MRALLIACGVALSFTASLTAQDDPIRCWWRTSQGAIAVGEPVDATLTCAVRDQADVRATVDESSLAAAVVQLAPFEVLGGTHPADLRSDTHRFFQYHYTMRIIDRDVIGRDAHLPDLPIRYRVQTLANSEWAEGRERTYTIRGGAVRVLSLVPSDAGDIRDATGAPFERVEALRFRARAFEIGAVALGVLGLIVAAPAVLSLARTRREARPAARPVSDRKVLEAVQRELERLQSEARGGWSEDLVARALAALRLAAAVATHREVTVKPAESGAVSGSLVISTGVFRVQRVAVASPVTSADIRATPQGAAVGETLAETIDALTRILYGRAGVVDARVEEAMETAKRAMATIPRRR